jgi:hypothetical protein
VDQLINGLLRVKMAMMMMLMMMMRISNCYFTTIFVKMRAIILKLVNLKFIIYKQYKGARSSIVG